MELVRPYVVLPVRYPIYHVPDCHFKLPMSGPVIHVANTPHGLYPPYRDPGRLQHTIAHFGVEFKVAAPLVATAARLLYFARSEATPFHIPDALHVNRDAAYEAGITTVIPTQEDYIRFNQHKAAAVVPKGKLATSTSWDEDWQRIRYCYNPWAIPPRKGSTYVYGSLDGTWMGRMLVSKPSMVYTVTLAQCMRAVAGCVPVLRHGHWRPVSATPTPDDHCPDLLSSERISRCKPHHPRWRRRRSGGS